MNSKLEIAINKAKAIKLLIFSLIFVAMSAWLWIISDIQIRRPPILIKTVSVIGFGFFCFGLVLAVKILCTRKPGLIIDKEGLLSNTNIGDSQFIAWKTIESFRVMTAGKRDTLLVYIDNAEEVINQQHKWRQWIMRYCLKKYGTPVSIGISVLKTDSKSLVAVLTERHQSFRRKAGA